MMRRGGLYYSLLALFLGWVGAVRSLPAEEAPRSAVKPLEVFVTILPVAYVIERIGGESVRVHVLAEKGQDPHTFEAAPRQIAALAKADVYFTVGLPFEERLIPKLRKMNPGLIVADTAKGIHRRSQGEAHDAPASDESPGERERRDSKEGKGGEAGWEHEADTHVWLSPDNARRMAENVCATLEEVRPERAEFFHRNLDVLAMELKKVAGRIQKILQPFRSERFYVFHPAFGYFGDEFGLEQVPLEIQGKSPTPKQIQAFIKRARAERVRIIFVQPQFDKKSAETIARAIGGAVMPMDPMAKDLLKNFEDMAEKLEKTLKK